MPSNHSASHVAETYRRGQVEWALWQWFADPQDKNHPPKAFLTRIKRLLELDRKGDVPRGAETIPVSRYTFCDEKPPGLGTDLDYTPFNAFCLAVGLDMLDAGFKQSEVVFVLRYLRGDLEREYERALTYRPVPRAFRLHQDMPDVPTFMEKGTKKADPRIFLILQKVELVERLTPNKTRKPGDAPVVLEPLILHGIEALREELHRMNYNYRHALVFEIALTAAKVEEFLKQAPIVKRGRRPADEKG